MFTQVTALSQDKDLLTDLSYPKIFSKYRERTRSDAICSMKCNKFTGCRAYEQTINMLK